MYIDLYRRKFFDGHKLLVKKKNKHLFIVIFFSCMRLNCIKHAIQKNTKSKVESLCYLQYSVHKNRKVKMIAY